MSSTHATTHVRRVDHTGLKVGQAITITVLILAFIVNNGLSLPMVLFVAISQLLAGLDAPFAPYRLIYQYLVKPSGLVEPLVLTDNPEPHRFAMLVGAVVNGLAALALAAGAPLVGWILVGIVVVLANLNFWLNYCVGCQIYYLLNRFGVRGFSAGRLQTK